MTRRSVSGIIVFLNNTPIKWLSKRQKTVETSTYGSEMVAAKDACELAITYRYMLRMLGVENDGPATLLGDNQAVVLSSTVPSSQIKKKHLSISYHQIRECIAAGICVFYHIPTEQNLADVLTKPLSKLVFHRLVRPILFRAKGGTMEPPATGEATLPTTGEVTPVHDATYTTEYS